MHYSRIQVQPMSGACGAVVHGVSLAREIDDETFAELEVAFQQNLVIFFRDQDMTVEQHKAFGRRFGSLNVHPRYVPLEGHPEVFPIRKDPEDARNVGGVWHQDLTHLPEPPLGSILHALEVPPSGGDTMFANQYLAFETLSEGLKETLEGMRAVHDNRIQSPKVAANVNATRTSKLRDDPQERDEPESEHPVVITHPATGRKALFINSIRSRRFAGMTEEESKPLLDYLFQHAQQLEFTCRFRWEKGSVAFWDNLAVMHRALNDYPGHKRYMNRVTVNGSRPH